MSSTLRPDMWPESKANLLSPQIATANGLAQAHSIKEAAPWLAIWRARARAGRPPVWQLKLALSDSSYSPHVTQSLASSPQCLWGKCTTLF